MLDTALLALIFGTVALFAYGVLAAVFSDEVVVKKSLK